MRRADLRKALADPNVHAFLRVIRAGETSQDEAAYRMMFGGELFDSFADHPRKKITKPLGRKTITSSAAGAYQFLQRTWDGLVKQYGFPDFSPSSQDEAAVALIAGRKALQDVIDGRIEQAIKKCALEWASLPGSPYGQPTKTLDQALEIYRTYGGVFRPVGTPAPVEDKSIKAEPMAPFIAAAIPALIEAVPSLVKIFGSGSEVSERNAKAAEIVVNAAKEAIGAKNEQELIEQIRTADPEVISAVQNAVKEVWYEIAVDTTGVDGARKANSETKEFWVQPAFWVTVLLLPLVYGVVYAVLYREGFTDEVKAMVVASVVSGLLGSIAGFWLGTSWSSSRKTDALTKK